MICADNGCAEIGCADSGDNAKQLVSLCLAENRCCVLRRGTDGSFLLPPPGLIGLAGLDIGKLLLSTESLGCAILLNVCSASARNE